MTDFNITPPIPQEFSAIPKSYVPDMRLKIDLYRKVARLGSIAEWEDLRAELVDRFGAWPPEVERVLLMARLRIWAHQWQIESIHLEDGFIVFGYTGNRQVAQLVKKSGGKLRVVDDKSAYLPIAKDLRNPEQILQAVQSLLQPV